MTFTGNFAYPIDLGQVIILSGKTKVNAKHLEIDLLPGNSITQNINLHLCLRLDKLTLVFNSKTDGNWSKNGIQLKLKESLIKENRFTINILIMLNEFLISFDTGLKWAFPCNTSYDQIKLIRVSNDFEYVSEFHQMDSLSNGFQSLDQRNWIFNSFIPKHFVAGDVIVMKLLILDRNFTICLFDDKLKRVIFQLKPKFNEKWMICDGEMQDTYDLICSRDFPFMLNKTFKLSFGFSASHIFTSIDGVLYFKHKFHNSRQLENLNGFFIIGKSFDKPDVKVTMIDYFNVGAEVSDGFESYSNKDCLCTCST